MLSLAFAVGVAVVCGVSADPKPWMNTSNTPRERAQILLPQLNLQEKIAMTFATHTSSASAKVHTSTGIGAVKYMSAFSCKDITDCIKQRNELQASFISGSRLGIPISFINEGLHGGASGGTIFPEPITTAMAWNKSLVTQISAVIAAEASATGVDTVFAPVVNMMTDPRFGRLQEGFGENPTIASALGAAAVRGLQGHGSPETYLESGKVCSLAKHFAAYGAAIGGLNGGPADVSNRTLHEVYLRPWAAVSKAGVRAVMPSHNTIHDIPAHANRWAIDGALRTEFGFGAGIALSDCNDIGAILASRMAANHSQAAALALKAGVDWDLQCGTTAENWGYGNGYLELALSEGQVTEADLDAVVGRVLQQKFAAGLFDAAPTDPAGASILDSPPHRQLAREAATQGIVLLKNDGSTLPMSLAGKTVAVFGELGQDTDAIVGTYVLSGAAVSTVADALTAAGAKVEYDAVCSATGTAVCNASAIAAAKVTAQAADVAIFVLGDGHGECGEWGDRDSLDLAGGQLLMLQQLAGVAPHTIVVLLHGRPQTFGVNNVALEQVDALFAAWRPGEEGASAIVDLITGAANPSGKLVQSWPRSVGQVLGGSSPFLQRVRGKWVANSRTCTADGRCYDGYVNADSTPLFFFGSGLSYTTFEYGALAVAPLMPTASAEQLRITDWQMAATDLPIVNVTVMVHNTGTTAGTEVVQVYVKDPSGLPFVPYWKRLVAFERVILAAGASASVTIPVSWFDLAMYDGDMTLRVVPGNYTLSAGGASNTDSSAFAIML